MWPTVNPALDHFIAHLCCGLELNIDIEITSWKARAYEIFTPVGEVSEIERVRFLIQNQRV